MKKFFLCLFTLLLLFACKQPIADQNTALTIKIVVEQTNAENKKSLSQISFLFSKTIVEFNNSLIAKNDMVIMGESVINTPKQSEITIKNGGTGKLILNGTDPIRIIDGDNAFSIIKPAVSEIESDSLIKIKINFSPKEQKSYTARILISSNDSNGDFYFSVTAAGVTPKPIAVVCFNGTAVLQNGTIDAGNVVIPYSTNIPITIQNDGSVLLSIDVENITISGSDVFIMSTDPGANISVGGRSSFFIECKPQKLGESSAIMSIPTNDENRNPITIILKVTGIKGLPVLELSCSNRVIANNSSTPFDFGRIEIGTAESFVFNMTNSGNIPLELTGNPIVESSNTNFEIIAQSAKKVLNPNETLPFIIQYSSAVEKEDIGIISILYSADNIFILNVKGAGYIKRPQITLKQNNKEIYAGGEFNFGSLLPGNMIDVTFEIVNSGEAALTFETVNGNLIILENNVKGNYSIIQQPFASTILQPDGITSFIIRFNPKETEKNLYASIHIKTNSRLNNIFSFWIKGDCGIASNSYKIGDTGPSGGIIFFAEGGVYKECSGELGQYPWADAATAAKNHRGGGFSNWSLPGRGELSLMYQNLKSKSLGSFYGEYYWSSEQNSTSYGWSCNFYNGNFNEILKTNLQRVRVVRTFTL